MKVKYRIYNRIIILRRVNGNMNGNYLIYSNLINNKYKSNYQKELLKYNLKGIKSPSKLLCST